MSIILAFPYDKIKKPEQREEPLDDAIADLISVMIENGYSVTGEDRIKDIALIMESVKSAMARSNGKYHGLQRITKNLTLTAA
jgi:hypothetical protein